MMKRLAIMTIFMSICTLCFAQSVIRRNTKTESKTSSQSSKPSKSKKQNSSTSQSSTVSSKPATRTLYFSCVPSDASVYIDGQYKGKANNYYSFPLGNHQIKFQAVGYKDKIMTITEQVTHDIVCSLDKIVTNNYTVNTNSYSNSASTSFSNGVLTVNGVSYPMVLVTSGTFKMGATNEMQNQDKNERPVHNVTLSSNYYIGKTEVTQALWIAVMGSNPSTFKGDNLPVENVSINDCQAFISKLNSLVNKTFRLPTEAEWEFAARGGNNSNHCQYSGSNNIDDVAWYDRNSGRKTHPVATKLANELGIYDMSGNVSEWVSDYYGKYSSKSKTNPQGPKKGACSIDRGGSWWSDTSCCCSAHRNYGFFQRPQNNIGLRLCLSE